MNWMNQGNQINKVNQVKRKKIAYWPRRRRRRKIPGMGQFRTGPTKTLAVPPFLFASGTFQ